MMDCVLTSSEVQVDLALPHSYLQMYSRDMMDCVLFSSEVDLDYLQMYSRDMMDCVLFSSEVDLGLPHSLEYLY